MAEEPTKQTATVPTKVYTVAELEDKKSELLVKSEAAAKALDVDLLKKYANEAASIKKMIENLAKAEMDKLSEANKSLIDSLIETLRQELRTFALSKQTIYDKLGALGRKVEQVRLEADLTEGGLVTFYAGPKKAVKAAKTDMNSILGVKVDGEKKSKSAKQVRLTDGTVLSTSDFVEQFATPEEKAGKTWAGGWKTALAPKIAKRVGATIEEKT